MSQCKYNMREHQISYDNGVTWSSLEVIKGELIEYESSDCPDSGSEITKWVDLEGDYICEDNHKYKKQILYVSYDGGATWYIYFPTTYRKGEYVGIDDELCNNKFEGHYVINEKIDPIKIVKCNGNPILTSGETSYYYNRRFLLTSCTIGDCVTEIGYDAFSYCTSLASVKIPNSVTNIGNEAFEYCYSLSSVTLPNSVTYIGTDSFSDCYNLSSINIPSGVTEIDCFNGCIRLSSITLSNSVTLIGYRAFKGCSSLASITIPSGVTLINNEAFYDCTSLTIIRVEAITPPTLGLRAFTNTNNCPIYVPCESLNAYKSAWSTYANRIICSAEPQYRTLTTATTCVGYDLYTLEEYQVSYDEGVTWSTTATSATTLIEADSENCGYVPPTPPTPTGFTAQYLTLVPKVTSTSFKFSRNSINYSLDSGNTWTSLASNTATPSVGVGEKIMFKASGLSISSSDGIGTFSGSSQFDVEGNVMSMMFGDDFSGQTSLSRKNYVFISLFRGSSVISAENLVLPATTLTTECYHYMFSGCTSLTVAPQLPATTLATSCYSNMFNGCSGLTEAPQLPSTTLANRCYNEMFRGCTSLTVAPQLPATTLASYCYYDMFRGCTSLTEAPQLPATTLDDYCYDGMFYNCTSLTTAPQLLATTLTQRCYEYMFYGCTSLNSITCLATVMSVNSTYFWVDGVSSSGIFYKASGMTSWDSGGSGIPTNWTIVDYQE